MQNPSQSQVFLSQSECNEALSCPMRWWARWFLGMQPPDEEDRPRRVGSMGHAILSDDVQATWRGDTKSPYTAVHAEAEKRGWFSVEEDEYQCALAAAGHVMTDAEIGWSSKHVLPDLYSETGDGNGRRGPLAEVRLRARWHQVAHFFTDDRGMPSKAWADIMRCEAVRQRYSGIEGQPDLVTLSPDLTTAIVDDYKFRQKPDLGGAQVEPDLPVPDRQAAWYLALLHSVGLRPAGGLVFRQVNVYAGRWLTLDDFLDAARRQANTVEQYRLVTD
jgi:hypothetical protein